MKRFLLLLPFLLFCTHQLTAQADSVALITDRPTQSASAYTIAKGTWQIETGFQYSNFKVEDVFTGLTRFRVETIAWNTSLIRYGITDKLELNIGQSLSSAKVFINDVQQGRAEVDLLPTTLGLRVQLAEEKGAFPQVSFLGNYVGAPFASAGTGGGVDMRFNMQHNLNNGWSIGYNVGGTGSGFFEDFTILYTFVVGKALSDQLATFVEAYGFFNDGASNPHSLDYGLTYLLNDDLQLDIYAGNALNTFATDFIFGFGFSARIPGN